MDRKKILIIEDDENTLKFMNFTLTNSGYDVIDAKNGITAIDILRDITPDCIIIDIVLPDIEGCTIFNDIKANKNFENIPLIFSSGKAEAKAEYESEVIQQKPDAFLLKPFTAEDLVQTVNNALNII